MGLSVGTATTLAPGLVVLDATPSSGLPVALTRVGLASAPAASTSAANLLAGNGSFAGSANGTAIGVALAPGSTASPLDIQVGGASLARIDQTGKIYAGGSSSYLWQHANGRGPVLGGGSANEVYTAGGAFRSDGGFYTSTTSTGLNMQGTRLGVGASGLGTQLSWTDLSGRQLTASGTALDVQPNTGSAAVTSARFGPSFIEAYVPFGTMSASVVPLVVRGAASQSADLAQFQSSGTTPLARVDAAGNAFATALVPTAGARITSGSGAPTTPGGANPVAGDVFHRTDTPTVANQRIYCCTVGGSTPTWVGIA